MHGRFVLLAVLALLSVVSATFEKVIDQSDHFCFHIDDVYTEDTFKKKSVEVHFIVSDGGFNDITFEVYNPATNLVLIRKSKTSEFTYRLTHTKLAGSLKNNKARTSRPALPAWPLNDPQGPNRIRFCFLNISPNSPQPKVVSFDITYSDNKAENPAEVLAAEDTVTEAKRKSVIDSLNMTAKARRIENEMRYIDSRYAINHAREDDTQRYIGYYTIAEAFVFMLVLSSQVVYFKYLFG